MVRLILEDIKLNKDKRINNPKKEIKDLPIVKAKERDTILNNSKKEVEYIKESNIDQYLSTRNNNKRISSTPEIKNKRRSVSVITLVVFFICFIFGSIYWVGNIFEKSTINIINKHEIISYRDKEFIASKDPSSGMVNFEIMIVSDKKKKNIILTEPKEVSMKAKGSIVLYNEFSTTPQKLLKGTFLSDEKGISYQIDTAVTIPGYKLVGKKINPGEVVVPINAFLAGDQYNGSPSSFHINSFKDTTKYNKIYGKLKDPLSGGIVGVVYTIDDSNKNNITNIAISSLKEDLIKKGKALVPSGYIFYQDAYNFSYKIDDNFLSKTPNAEIEIEGVLSIIIFKEKSLLDNILKTSLKDIKGEELKEINISNLNNLSFSFLNKDELITKDTETISFYLNGEVDAVWSPDIEKLKMKLLGIKKDNTMHIFKEDNGIDSASVVVFPFWQKYISNDLSKINIIID